MPGGLKAIASGQTTRSPICVLPDQATADDRPGQCGQDNESGFPRVNHRMSTIGFADSGALVSALSPAASLTAV